MNREIKFRVWDNVDYMSTPFTLRDIMQGKIEFTSDCPVMQFTGLKDKNGKEIYEGDVVKCGNDIQHNKLVPLHGVIEKDFYELPSDEIMCLTTWIINCEKCGGKWSLGLISNKESYTKNEVIGNIYENSELLK